MYFKWTYPLISTMHSSLLANRTSRKSENNNRWAEPTCLSNCYVSERSEFKSGCTARSLDPVRSFVNFLARNPSESVKIRQNPSIFVFSRYRKNPEKSYVTFRLFGWLLGNGSYFQVVRDLRHYKIIQESKCILFFFQSSHAGLVLTFWFWA